VDEKTIKTSDYLKVSLQEAMGLLKTNADGLSTEEVKKRLKEFGYNEITETKKNPLLQL
jgi:magnesium-transporting ATPase (P-type)